MLSSCERTVCRLKDEQNAGAPTTRPPRQAVVIVAWEPGCAARAFLRR